MATSTEAANTPPIPVAEPLAMEGLSTLVSVLGAVVGTIQLTKNFELVDEQRRAAMLPFNLSPPSNTLFQFGSCVLVALSVAVLYAGWVYPRLTPLARRLDLLVATLVLPLMWWSPSARIVVTLLAARALFPALLVAPSARLQLGRWASAERLAALAPPLGLLACAALFTQMLPSGMGRAVLEAPGWLRLLAAAPFLLFLIEELLSPAALRWVQRSAIVLGLFAIPLVTYSVAAPYFDFSTIVGPVNDVLLGKDLLDSVVSTYGFLLVYTLAALFRVFQVSDPYIGLAVINAVAYSVGYGAIFLFLSYRIRRPSLCLSSLVTLIALHYFHMNGPITWVPQCGFLRFGGMLPVFALLYALDEAPTRRWLEWLLAAASAVALLWTIEVGAYIALGLAASLGRELLLRTGGERRALHIAGKVALCVGAVLLIFTVWILLRHGHWPVWGDLLHFQRAYAAGLAMGHLESIERWPILIFVYGVVLFAALRVPGSMRHSRAWIFLAAFGLAAMVYPLGKASGNFDLGRVVLPAILLVTCFLGCLLDRQEELVLGRGSARISVAHAASLTWFAAGALVACFVYAEVRPQLANAREVERRLVKPVPHEAPSWKAFFPTPAHQQRFQRDLTAIRTFVPAGEALPIISRNDTLYYVFGERKSLFKNSFHPHFFFKSDLDEIAQSLLASPVTYLFLDGTKFQSYENVIDAQIADGAKARVLDQYRFLGHAGFLDVYQRVVTTALR